MNQKKNPVSINPKPHLQIFWLSGLGNHNSAHFKDSGYYRVNLVSFLLLFCGIAHLLMWTVLGVSPLKWPLKIISGWGLFFLFFWFHYCVLKAQLFSHRPTSQTFCQRVGPYFQQFLFNCFSLSTLNMIQLFYGFIYLSAVSQLVSLTGLYAEAQTFFIT